MRFPGLQRRASAGSIERSVHPSADQATFRNRMRVVALRLISVADQASACRFECGGMAMGWAAELEEEERARCRCCRVDQE